MVVFGGRVAGAEGEGVSDELVTLVAKGDAFSVISIEHVCALSRYTPPPPHCYTSTSPTYREGGLAVTAAWRRLKTVDPRSIAASASVLYSFHQRVSRRLPAFLWPRGTFVLPLAAVLCRRAS